MSSEARSVNKKILVVTYDWPSDLGGYNKSVLSCVEQYSKYFDVTLLVFSEEEKVSDLSQVTEVIHTKILKRNPLRDFLLSVISVSPATERRYRAEYRTAQRLVASQRFDLVIVQGVLLGGFIDLVRRRSPCILMSHDYFGQAYKGIWRKKNALLRLPWRLEESKLIRLERENVSKADRVYAITDNDKNGYLNAGLRCDGVFYRFPEADLVPPITTPKQDSMGQLLSIGRIDDRKTIGVRRFTDDVMPKLAVKLEQVTLTLIGAGSQAFHYPDKGIFGLGFVDDVSEYYLRAPIFLNLQEQGAGFQFKLIDALRHRRIVVTSALSASSLPSKLRQFCLVYENLHDLYTLIVTLLTDRVFLESRVGLINTLRPEDFVDFNQQLNNREIIKDWV